MLVLPYKVGKVLPEIHLSRRACRSKELGSFFNIKDRTKLELINGLTYLVKFLKRHPQKTILEKQQGELMKGYQNMLVRIRSQTC